MSGAVMRITVDTEANTISCQNADGQDEIVPFFSKEGFELISKLWLKQEWNQLHWQSFSWFGLQIWQLQEDIMRLQEVVAVVQPEVIAVV